MLNAERKQKAVAAAKARVKIPSAVEEVVASLPIADLPKGAAKIVSEEDKLLFPELMAAGIDEKALRASPLGKVLFAVLDKLFPVFKEPNWCVVGIVCTWHVDNHENCAIVRCICSIVSTRCAPTTAVAYTLADTRIYAQHIFSNMNCGV